MMPSPKALGLSLVICCVVAWLLLEFAGSIARSI